MPRAVVAMEFCKACELCLAFCPKDCFVQADTLNAYGVYPMQFRDGAKCTGCAQCALMCPDAAIEVYRSPAKESRPQEKPA
jgi:2-oxoglutarate ferredoxin oxidoreductase subunit delta